MDNDRPDAETEPEALREFAERETIPAGMKVHTPSIKIRDRVHWLAEQIEQRFGGPSEVHLVVVLDGAFVFAADLARAFRSWAHVHFVGLKSYEGMTAGDAIHWTKWIDPGEGVRGKPCIIVDDIVETGRTMRVVRERLERLGPSHILTCSLVYKSGCGSFEPDFYGIEAHREEFLVGYGLDLDGRLRGLPFIGSVPR